MTSKNNSVSISSFVADFLSVLDERHREIIKARYGLQGGGPLTLQAIGNRYGITRERVRQIEEAALTILRKKTNAPYFKSFVQTAVNTLKKAGGLEKEDQFLRELAKLVGQGGDLGGFMNAARFLIELSGKAAAERDKYSPTWHHHWYLTEADKKKAYGFIAKLESLLHSKKPEILAGRKFEAVFAAALKAGRLEPAAARNYLAISKKFVTGPFGEFGLASWPEINPKTARDWAYAILKKEQRPLHFSEIAKAISSYRKDRRTNLQTVHNELIKDKRFVLVGRGMYGLSEFGLIPGTAKEIIAHLLKKNGPLVARDVVRLVKEQRFFKEGTIMINLQNRKHFECRPDGRYCVHEA